jgi:hypothetical protein
MSDEIVFEGNIYVSSRRASEISSYAQDYIGQLARKGLIEARRVGGLWYVVMSSLENYKSNAASGEVKEAKPTIGATKDSESSIEFEGSTYISASRASEITGYNQDYVGQLARAGKIPSRQIGNRWYVDPSAIQQHKREKDELLAKVQAESVGISTTVAHKQVPNAEINHQESQLLTYKSTEGDLIPHIKEREYSDIKIERVQQQKPYADAPRVRVAEMHHINRPRIETQYKRIAQPRYVDKANNDKKVVKYAFTGIIIVLILISIIVGFFKFGSVNPLITQMQNLNASDSSLVNSGVLSRVLETVEQLISPQLLYIRK